MDSPTTGPADTEIEGATGVTYTLRPADVGQAIKVRVTFTDQGSYVESLTSSPFKVEGEAEAHSANTPAWGMCTIYGMPLVGSKLRANPRDITDADGLTGAIFTFQWFSNDGSSDTDIQGATGVNYTLRSDDEGKTLRVRVGFTDDRGSKETLTSKPTVAVATQANLRPVWNAPGYNPLRVGDAAGRFWRRGGARHNLGDRPRRGRCPDVGRAQEWYTVCRCEKRGRRATVSVHDVVLGRHDDGHAQLQAGQRGYQAGTIRVGRGPVGCLPQH